jgi:hypothetical protein
MDAKKTDTQTTSKCSCCDSCRDRDKVCDVRVGVPRSVTVGGQRDLPNGGVLWYASVELKRSL